MTWCRSIKLDNDTLSLNIWYLCSWYYQSNVSSTNICRQYSDSHLHTGSICLLRTSYSVEGIPTHPWNLWKKYMFMYKHNFGVSIEAGMSSRWWLCRHWLSHKLTFWQLPVCSQWWSTNTPMWWPARFSAQSIVYIIISQCLRMSCFLLFYNFDFDYYFALTVYCLG